MYTILKSYFRNFKKQKLIYSITIGGFAISLAVLVLIASYIVEEKSVDKHYTNINNMYRIKQADENAQIPKRIYQAVLDAAPEIECMCLISSSGTLFKYGNKKKNVSTVSVNKQFLDVFSIKIIKGNDVNLLQSKTDVLITEEFAHKVFGDKNPIGEIIEFGNKERKEVKAVIANPSKTSSLKYEVVFNLEQQLYKSTRGYNKENYYMHDAVFVLRPEANPADIERKIKDILTPLSGYEKSHLTIQPFKEVYFDLKGDNDSYAHANMGMLRLLSIIALIIFLLAISNYINLTTAFNNERYKEICIRKTSGADSKTIFYQFVGESYLSVSMALIMSIGFAILLSPIFRELFNREINIIEAIQKPTLILIVTFTFLIVGAISGLIPAFVVSKFNPIDLLQRKIKLQKSNIRGTYNTFQILVTISLIICLIAINKQIKYVKTKDVGFNKEFLLGVQLQGRTKDKVLIIKEKLLRHPQILNITGTHGRPFATYSSGSGSWQIDSVDFDIQNLINMNTDTAFLSTFELKLIQGRNFRSGDKDACIINKKTYDHLQFKNLEEKNIWGNKIVGVVEDFHFKKMHSELGFIQLRYEPQNVSHINIRISGNNIPATLSQIENIFKEFEPAITFNPRFYDDWINNMYQKEEKQAKAIKIYSIMALILSCLGLIGMAEFSSTKRVKEIGIRKVNGAKTHEILALLNKDFIKWVAIAFIIACPLAYYAMNIWLQNFAYKTELSWWIFAISGLVAIGITLITVSWQSWKAATRNPVEALRYE